MPCSYEEEDYYDISIKIVDNGYLLVVDCDQSTFVFEKANDLISKLKCVLTEESLKRKGE